MTTPDDKSPLAERMATQLRVREGPLAKVAARAGRKMPRHVRKDVKRLVDAEMMARHPKLRKQLSPRELKQAERRVGAFLDGRDPRKERKNAVLDMIASVAFVICVVALGFFFYLLWTGALT